MNQNPFSDLDDDPSSHQWSEREQAVLAKQQREPTRIIQVKGDTAIGPEAGRRIIQVKGDTAISRTIGDLLQLLAGQPVGSVSEKLIEAAAGVSALQRENALLRMENEDLKLRLRAGGVQMP